MSVVDQPSGVDMKAKLDALRAKTEANNRIRAQAEWGSKKASLEGQLARGQLALWPDTERGLPNELARCAVFSAKNKREERIVHRADSPLEVPIIGGGKVSFIGEELRQDDETVWAELVHRAKEARSESIEFVPHELITSLKWPPNGASYKRLLTIIRRLSSTTIEVYSSRFDRGIPTRLLRSYEYSTKDTQRPWKIQVFSKDDELLFLFDKLYTRFDWERRLSLPVGVATWLHSFYSSHRDPFPHKFETLAMGAGLKLEIPEGPLDAAAKKKLKNRMKEVRNTLMDAHEALKVSGFLESYEIKRGLVHVVRAKDAK